MMNQDRRDTTEQIWRELSDRLRQFVQSRIESLSDVDDILQTVFLRIHSRFDELRNVDRLESWVFQITRNAIIDHFRRKRNFQDDVESALDQTHETQGQNENATVANCLVTLIEHLPEEQRQAVSLYELEGMSQKDIAHQESISLSGIKSRIQRGRKSLEAMLKDCCEFQFDRRGNVVEFERVAPDCCNQDCHR